MMPFGLSRAEIDRATAIRRRRWNALRALVIGCGSVGHRHAVNLAALGVGEVVAYDPDAGCRARLAAKASAAARDPHTPDLFSALRVVDDLAQGWNAAPGLVVIAAPPHLHVPLARQAAGRGCDVFIEKPLSNSLDGVSRLVGELERRRLVSMVGCNMRYHPGPSTVRRWLGEGLIGDPLAARLASGSYLPRWRPWQDYRASYSASPEFGGAILDCIHEIDLAQWLLGPARLAGACWTPATAIGLKTDGLAELLLRHERGGTSSVHLNFVQRDYHRTCQVIGTIGTIYWDWEAATVTLHNEEGCRERQRAYARDWDVNRMYLAEMRAFLRAVQQRRPAPNPVCEAAATLALALAARRAGAPSADIDVPAPSGWRDA